jgi:hypothetical protein
MTLFGLLKRNFSLKTEEVMLYFLELIFELRELET